MFAFLETLLVLFEGFLFIYFSGSRCLLGLEGVAGLIMEDFAAFLIPQKTISARSGDNEVPGIVLAMTHLEQLNNPAQLERQIVMKKRKAIQV